MSEERIAKYLARMGIASRRKSEQYISDGRIEVNGEVLTSFGYKVVAGDRVAVDGELLPNSFPETKLWLFYKPTGVITTHQDTKQRQTVFDLLPKELGMLSSVGRLDYNTEGLLLLTNNGDVVHYLESPETGWVRKYKVRVYGKVNKEKMQKLKDGIVIEGIQYGSVDVEIEITNGSNSWLLVSLSEGKNKEVRNIMEHFGLKVSRLIRVSYGPFQLGKLPKGHIKEVSHKVLKEQLGNKIAL